MPVSPTPGEFLDDRFARVDLLYDDMVTGSRDFLTIQGDMPVDIAGAQLELLYDPAAVELGVPELAADIQDVQMRSHDDGQGRLTVLLYCSDPGHREELILAGRSDLVKIPIRANERVNADDKSQLVLNQALLATTDAAAVKVEGAAQLPGNFHLSQNYPNPFNPSTTIEFTLGAPGAVGSHDVSLRIYNILGQEVNSLFEGTLPSGNHSVAWDGNDQRGRRVASGIYLYKLQVGDQSQTKKMVLLK
jgi:hypothetical protein